MKNKGITLVALVITIIVLLILAGITISLVLGDKGIVLNAKEAKLETRGASVEEQVALWKTAIEMKKYTGGMVETYESIRDRLYGEKLLTKEDIEELKKPENINLEVIIGSKTISFKTDSIEENRPIFTTVANVPDISQFNKDNTYYVAWDLTSSPYTIKEETKIKGIPPSNWYDYTSQKNEWANVKTTGGGNDCYWVWIPRYAYKVPIKDTPATIEVKFLKDNTNIPIGETEAITNTTPTPENWVVHPAFTNEGNNGFGELTGIWVAKYEASSSSVSESTLETDLNGDGGGNVTSLQVRVKPNVVSWRSITVSNIFTVCQNITTSGNSLEGSTKIDSHMMKNTEWGACAYLSRSIYGKNGAVWNNPYYTDYNGTASITGLAGETQDTSKMNLENTYQYNMEGGGNASTSGNVYGVYDMAAGAWECVAGYVNNSNANNTKLLNADAKYKDVYTIRRKIW